MGRKPLLPARSPRPVRERLAPAARRRPHLSLLLHARRAPRRQRAARQRRHAHLPRRLPRPFGRRGRPPQCPAHPGHAPTRARHRRPRRRRDRIRGPHVRGPMRGTRHRVRRFFGVPQRRRFCLSASRGGRRRCHGRHRGRARMRPAGLHAAPNLPAASAGTSHAALRTYSAAHVTGWPPPFQARPRSGPGRAPRPLWHARGAAGLARRANGHRAGRHATLCRAAGRAL